VLVVADPVFDPADARARAVPNITPGTSSTAMWFGAAVTDVAGIRADNPTFNNIRFKRLAATRDEGERIAKFARDSGMKADLWLDLEASEGNATARDLREYQIIHVATHGLLNTRRPNFTGIVLSLVGNRGSTDGFLRTDEIFNLRLSSPLVMLSACETGLGREKRGEGVIGLTRAFMYAGAPTVGVSLWSVADKSTAELMSDFYQNLLGTENSSPAAAMRVARQKMIDGKRYSAPFYWAPFVLVGDWR
jgi:CHAT domain-containing protein